MAAHVRYRSLFIYQILRSLENAMMVLNQLLYFNVRLHAVVTSLA